MKFPHTVDTAASGCGPMVWVYELGPIRTADFGPNEDREIPPKAAGCALCQRHRMAVGLTLLLLLLLLEQVGV